MDSRDLIAQIKAQPAPKLENVVAELELMQFEREMLRNKVRLLEEKADFVESAQAQLDEAAAQMVVLKNRQQAVEAEARAMAELRQQLAEQQAKAAELLIERDQHVEMVRELRTIRSGLEERIAGIDEIEKRNAELEGRTKTLVVENQNLAAETQKLTGALDEHSSTSQQAQQTAAARITELERKLQALTLERDAAGNELETGRAQHDHELREQEKLLEKEKQASAHSLAGVQADYGDVLNDLIGVLLKMGTPPASVLFAKVPGYKRLAHKYAKQLTAGAESVSKIESKDGE